MSWNFHAYYWWGILVVSEQTEKGGLLMSLSLPYNRCGSNKTYGLKGRKSQHVHD